MLPARRCVQTSKAQGEDEGDMQARAVEIRREGSERDKGR